MTQRRLRRESSPNHRSHRYHVYGLRLASTWPLPYPTSAAPWIADIALRRGSAARFEQVLRDLPKLSDTAPWVSASLPDGTRYLRWTGAFDFLIPADGRRIECRPLTPHLDAFHTHLGPSLSFALINLGFEPLHSTTLAIEGGAVALMGDCGYGKSSLGASFIQAGYSLLTDDLLVVINDGTQFIAYPGAPRVKLYPAIAKVIFGPRVRGLRLSHALSPKLIIPLEGRRSQRTPLPLRAIYMLTPPSARVAPRVTIRRLSPRRAFLELVRNTFNMSVSDPARLERQFALATALSMSVPVKTLSYPRRIDLLDAARRAILHDLSKTSAASFPRRPASSPHRHSTR